MASPIWRKRGYVPDSEDEDECSLSEQSVPTSDARQLQRHGRDDLDEQPKPHQSTRSPASFKHFLEDVDDPTQDFARGSSVQQPEPLQSFNSPLTTAPTTDQSTSILNEANGERPAHWEYNSNDSSPLSSIADELSSELEFGLQTIEEILHPIPNDTRTESGIGGACELHQAPVEERQGAIKTTETQPLLQQSDLGNFECDLNNGDYRGAAGPPTPSQQRPLQRALRQRNPIQLHPYALEFSRYQQSLKARGLRPQRIASPERERSSSPFETQEGEAIHTPSRDGVLARSGKQEHRREDQLRATSVTAKGKRGDDLPDLEDLLRDHLLPRDTISGNERRHFEREKSPEHHSISQRNDSSIFDFPDQEDSGITSEFLNGSSNVPLSPPRSGSSSAENPRDQSPVFRYPLGLTPPKPPTPAASSEPRRATLNKIDTYRSSDPTTSLEEEDKSSSSTSDASNDDEEDQALRRMARRIHGVLPATYLRFGSKASFPPPQSSMPNSRGAARDIACGPGVARKIRSSERGDQDRDKDHAAVFLDSDDSSPESEARIHNRITRYDASRLNANGDIFLSTTVDEVIEDNTEIDFMTPQEHRRHKKSTGKRPKKRQKRLDDLRDNKVSRVTNDSPSSKSVPKRTRHRIEGQDGQPSHQRKVISRNASWPARLGILDSADVVQLPKRSRPQFLRIAARKARSQKGRGRKYPNYRQILLAPTEENEDLDANSEAWHSETNPQDVALKPSATGDRPALSELSNLQQNIRASLPGQAAENILLQQRGLEDTTSEETRVPDDFTELNQADRNLRPPFTTQQKASKRFGNGSLLTTFGATTVPRAAQAEQDKLSRHSGGSLSTKFTASTSGLPPKAPKDELEIFRLEKFLKNRSRKDNNPTSTSASSGHPYVFSKPSQPRRARKRPPRSLHGSHEGVKAHQNLLDEPSWSVHHPVLVCVNDLTPFEALDGGRLLMQNAFEATSFIGSGRFSQLISTVFFANDRGSPSKAEPKDILRAMSIDSFALLERRPWDTLVDPSDIMSLIGSNWIPQVSSGGNADDLGLREDQLEDVKDKLMSIVTFIFYRLGAKSIGFQTQFMGELLKVNANLLGRLEAIRETIGVAPVPHRAALIAMLSRFVLLSFKVWHVAHVLSDDNSDLCRCAESQLKDVVRIILYVDLEPSGIEALRKQSHREGLPIHKSFGPEDVEVESIVIVNNIILLYRDLTGLGSIWEPIQEIMSKKSSSFELRISQSERYWKVLFTLLPFLEIGSHGCRQEICQQPEDTCLWKIVQDLLNPTTTTFDRLATDSLFYRCYCLAISWGWNITPDALNMMFEMLLLQIDGAPLNMPTRSLDDISLFCHSGAEQTDPSSLIALKLMAQSIYKRRQSGSVTERNASSLVAKIIPTLSCGNYRTPNKLDLSLIRQQFDVLSIIYVSAPEISRPTLRQFKRLVPMQQASISVLQNGVELCERMMHYELKTKQGTVEFTGWLDEIGLDISGRWKRGQPIASGTAPPFNPYLLEHQHLLIHSLLVVQDLISQCTHGDQVTRIIPKNFLLQIFHSALQEIRLQDLLPYGLSIIKGMVTWPRTEKQLHQKGSEDDSQDFGNIDWAVLDEERENGRVNLLHWMLNHFYLPLKRLLSSVLRSESPWSKPTFEDIVKCWASVAHSLVREGLREWSAYLEPQADDSWAHFEDCTRRNDGMMLFLTEIMRSNQYFYSTHQEAVLKCYLQGLIDLDIDVFNLASLHRLILNSKLDDSMFQCTKPKQTRIEIVTTVIINMQQIWYASDGSDLNNGTFKLVKELGHHLIQSMVSSWRNSRHDSILTAQRKVDFFSGIVHALIIHLPEYAPHLEFFTHGEQFPYKDTAIFVRVQGYARQLLEGKNVGKVFITYIHSLLENAAANAGGEGLLTQIILAMGLNSLTENLSDETIQHAEKVRSGETVPLVSAPLPAAVDTRETYLLRLFLLGNVFPSYIADAFTPTGRFLFKPILGILTRAYEVLSLYSSQWDDITRLHRVTQEILNVARTALASSALQEHSSVSKSQNEIQDYQHITEGLEQLIDLAEATVEYMDRVRECQCGDENVYEDEERREQRRDGYSIGAETITFPTARERELSRYTERTIEDWKKQVEVRQGAYFVRAKCIGPV